MEKFLKIKFDKQNSVEVEKNYVVDNYLSKDDGTGYSIVRTHLNGSHPFMKNTKSNRTYYFLNGNAVFNVGGEKVEVRESEMLVIPKDTKYAFNGKFEALLVDCPAFDPIDDVIYDEFLED